MRALSIQQPWASLIIIGAKRIETRSWPCPPHLLGETIAIHASQRFPMDAQYLCLTQPFLKALDAAGHAEPELTLPRGAVLGTARIVACVRTEELLDIARARPLSEQERAFGDYRPGRWGWILGDVKRFETPVPAKGALGLWRWDGVEASNERAGAR